MRFAYADPPYPGMAHLYKDHPDYAGEVDHKALIARLVEEFPDGWALSTSSKTLVPLIKFSPNDVRILSWSTVNPRFPPVKGFVSAWQPCILRGGRGVQGIVTDMVVENLPIGLHNHFTGGKPESYCFWLFRCLGALPGDDLVDLFPGSGAVARAWDKFQRQMTLPRLTEKGKQARLVEAAG